MIGSDVFTIGVDIGTTSTKAAVFDRSGQVKGRHAVGYPLRTTALGAAEQDPDVIYTAVLESIRGAIAVADIAPERIRCAGFSSALHSLIAVDAGGRPLTPSITWADTRSVGWADKIRAEMDGQQIYRRTGTPIHPMSPFCKLVWLRHERPDIFAATHRFVGIKEYVFFRLFGQWVIDFSIASATCLFNLAALDWDAGALAVAGIDAGRLSRPVPPTHCLDGLAQSTAADLHLLPRTPFVVGANDGVLSNLGVDAIHAGDVAVTIGTSGAVRAVVDRPLTDPNGRTFCYLLTPATGWSAGRSTMAALSSAGCATSLRPPRPKQRSGSASTLMRSSLASPNGRRLAARASFSIRSSPASGRRGATHECAPPFSVWPRIIARSI